MHGLILSALSVLLSAGCVVASPAEPAARRDDCEDVHIFVARGNNEESPGRQINVTNAICSGRDSCGWEDIAYTNPTNNVYATAVYEGAVNGLAQITAYAATCPTSQFVLTGYSQGAHVIGDILGGGGGVFETLGGGTHQGENATEYDVVGFNRTSGPGTQSKLACRI